MQVKIVKMRPLLKSAYYFSLLCWIFVIVESSDDTECIVHGEKEEFHTAIVTVPPVTPSFTEVELLIKDIDNEEGITIKFDKKTEEWYYLDWTHKGISSPYHSGSRNKSITIEKGQASGNCDTGKFKWEVTGSKNTHKLYNTDKLQTFRITILKDTEVSYSDEGSAFYLCRKPVPDSSIFIKETGKCIDDEGGDQLLELHTDYTLQVEKRQREQNNINASESNTFVIKGKSVQHTMVFEPTDSVENNEELLGYIVEEATSNLGDRTPTVTPGISSDVTCTSESTQSDQDDCPNRALNNGPNLAQNNGNVSIIVLGLLVAILLIALILTCLFFKKRQMGDKLHPMSDSHTNGNAGDAVKGNNDYNAMEEMRENSATDKTQFKRISQMPTTLEEENDIYDSAANVLDRQI